MNSITYHRTQAVDWTFAELGWSFTPLNGKRPTRPGWQKAERETREQATAWAEAGNVGLRTGAASGVIVIDVDEGGNVEAFNLPATVTATTGSGGRHYYFKAPAQPIRNSAGKLSNHVDIRGDGGQVVFPGSVHPDTGRAYQFDEGAEPWNRRLADLPANVIEAIEGDRKQKAEAATQKREATRGRREHFGPYVGLAVRQELHNVATAAEGTRNDTLNRAAYNLGQFVGGGYLDAGDVRLMLRQAASEAGLDWHEAHSTIDSGLTAGQHKPRTIPERSRRTITVENADGEKTTVTAIPPQKFTLDAPGNADRAEYLFGEDVHWCEERGVWFVWNGKHWQEDKTREVERRAEATILALGAEAQEWEEGDARDAAEKWATRCAKSNAARRDILDTLKHRRAIAEDALDREDWRLACWNGVVDLRTGKLETPHRREHLITRIVKTDYQPDREPVLWLRFLDEIMGGDQEMIGALQRLAGYWLTGDISEQILPICYGNGQNGKSVFLDTITNMLGAYGGKAADSLLTATMNEQHPTEIADLRGRRVALASETEEGRRLRVGLVKQLTGDDTLKGRFMRQDFFEFRRTVKIVLATNNKPVVTEGSNAVWRRLRLIPFAVQIPEAQRDGKLKEKLEDEWGAILAWMVEGCLDWQRRGSLDFPDRIMQATADYKADSDTVGTFLEECTEAGEHCRATRAELRGAYETWADEVGERPMKAAAFNARIRDAGYTDGYVMATSGNRVRGWLGIAVKETGDAE